MPGLTRDQITHCRNHHPFDAANTAWDSQGNRRCKTCRRNTDAARAARRRLERERTRRRVAVSLVPALAEVRPLGRPRTRPDLEYERLIALGVPEEPARVLAVYAGKPNPRRPRLTA